MRAGVFIVLGLITAVWPAHANEKLPVLKAGSEVYSNVTVTTVTATDIYFTYPNGMGNAKLKSLSPDLQKHFHYNPAKAGEVEQKQTAANTQYRIQAVNQPVPRPPADKDPAPPASAGPVSRLSWGSDLPGALNQARSENKMVLLDFTGSDWCSWCIKFDHDVLSTGQFAGYAKSKLVLVKLDFPHHKPQNDALKRANQELATRYHVDGFPTCVLLNSAGRELGRQVGYLRGGPDAFIAELDGFGR
jgi:protein disulfide-isomerase